MILNSPYISGSLTVTGNTTLIGALTVTGSLAGTATSSSFAYTASSAVSAYTAASAVNATTALTASYATSFTVGGTLTAQTLVVQTITSSVSFITGSTRFGSLLTNTHQFTGSLQVTGSGPHYIFGNVGIGTAAPARLLHLTGSGDTYIRVDGNNIQSLFGTDNIGTYIGQQGAFDLRIITNAAERFRITSAGTSSFTANVLASAADAATINLKQNSTTANTGIYLERSGEQKGYYIYVGGSVDSLTFQRNNAGTKADVMSLTRDGNVGIGTSSPATTLNIVGGNSNVGSTTSDYGLAIQAPTSMAEGVGGSILLQGYKTGTSAIGNFAYVAGKKENGTAANEAGYLSFGTFNSSGVPAERMRITSAGIVQLGNTSYSPRMQFRTGGSTAYSATINTDSKNDYISINGGDSTGYASGADIGLVGANRYGTATAGQLELGAGSATNNTNYGYIAFYTANTLRMQISFNGAIGTTAGGTNIYNPSDIRLKRNITSLSYGLNEILALKPSKFNWKEKFAPSEENKNLLGFIAQEVQTVIPEAVESFGQDVHVNTEGIQYTVENPLRVNEKFIIPVLVKAIQELKAEIDELKNK